MIKFILGTLGFSEAEVAIIENALPAMERLLNAQADFEPLIKKYNPDMVSVIPAAKIIMARLNKDK